MIWKSKFYVRFRAERQNGLKNGYVTTSTSVELTDTPRSDRLVNQTTHN